MVWVNIGLDLNSDLFNKKKTINKCIIVRRKRDSIPCSIHATQSRAKGEIDFHVPSFSGQPQSRFTTLRPGVVALASQTPL